MKSPSWNPRASGFSLIEVLIAVVILSVGLLALASLQLSLIQSSSSTKAQTIAAGLAKEKIESIRAYTSLGAATNSYRSLTAGASGTSEPLNDNGSGDLGGVNFTRKTFVTRYMYNKATSHNRFEPLTNAQNIFTDAQITALNDPDGTSTPQWVLTKDFKRVTVSVTWTDASGQPMSVNMEDIVDSLDPTESASVVSVTSTVSGARKLEKKISDPALDNMVIPIAVGGGSESAASNPKPVVTVGHDTVQTHFDVYTYNAVSGGTANVQQLVSTDVVGCKCNTASPPATSVRGKRPTYWDGTRYAVPADVDATGAGSYSPISVADSTVTQSPLCTQCCRDHVDPVGVKGPTFSPRLVTKDSNDTVTATTHRHYLTSDGLTWTLLASGGKYNEACRVILVDGFHRVAADLSNDYYGLLATQELSNPNYYASGWAPDSGATTNYQAFVVDYLDTRFTNNTVNTTYNTSPSTTSLVTAHSLDLPASINIPSTFNGNASPTRTITGISQTNPAVVTSAAHGFSNGDRVVINNVVGMTKAGPPTVSLNGRSFIISGVTANSFQLVGLDTSLYSAYTSGGTAVVNHAKWLHARGLYMDYLEKDAIAAVDNAKTNCPSQSGSAYSDCVLKVLPFTSINLTEISDWYTSTGNASDGLNVDGANVDYLLSSSVVEPVRGKVKMVGSPANGTNVVINAKDRKSNTGLLDLVSNAVSAADAVTWDTTPAQAFVTGAGGASSGTFYAVLSIPPKTLLGPSWISQDGSTGNCTVPPTLVSGTYYYPCTVSTALASDGLGYANAVSVTVHNYNSVTTGVSTPIPNGTTCTGPFGNKTYNSATGYSGATTYTSNTCNVYQSVSAVNSTLGNAAPTSTTVTNASGQSAVTRFDFSLINKDPNTGDSTYQDVINITFGTLNSTAAPVVCTYTCGPPGTCASANKTIIAATATCTP